MYCIIVLSNFNGNCNSGCVLYVQLLDVDPQDQAEEEGANVDLDSQRKGKCAVIKTSTRQVSTLYVSLLANILQV